MEIPQQKHTGLVSGTIIGKRVSIPMQIGISPCFNNNQCDYLASPADVISRAGVPAASFTNFPFTLLP